MKGSHMIHLVVYHPAPDISVWISEWMKHDVIEKATIVADHYSGIIPDKAEIRNGKIGSGRFLNELIQDIKADYILFADGSRRIQIYSKGLSRILEVADITGAGIVYSDFYEQDGDSIHGHPVIDYQVGSIRDDFDFGSLMLFSNAAIRQTLKKYGPVVDVPLAGFYDLRLKVSAGYPVFHIPEYLYLCHAKIETLSGERLFDYVDPTNRAVQKEMERIATMHLKRIGAFLEPVFRSANTCPKEYPIEASVIIPVRNRVNTIGDAVESALSQKTDFPFNVLVVDNHSSDGTGTVVSQWAQKDHRVHHIIPQRIDLGIGGCWNEAIYSEYCGRYTVQLDSDDLYSSPKTLRAIVDMLHTDDYGMVIGSYTLVNTDMQIIPPGLIDHREWTEENGRNNALRINGLGAPRAFVTDLIREIGFLNVSYGEDYAAALAVCREFRIGRIYDSLYLCRRWDGNTDAKLSIDQKNRNDFFKDRIRSLEMMARQPYQKNIE